MPRGGKRLGSGRKPHTRRERWLGGNAGKRPLVLVTPERVVDVPAEAISAPGVLVAGEQEYWQLWAPIAQARGLLTEATIPGFVLLCQQAYMAAQFRDCIQSRGYEQEKVTIDGAGQEHREYKANSLISHWRALMARVEQLQARYGIAADGKVPVGESADSEEEQLDRLLAVK